MVAEIIKIEETGKFVSRQLKWLLRYFFIFLIQIEESGLISMAQNFSQCTSMGFDTMRTCLYYLARVHLVTHEYSGLSLY
jgi:hypothetical protein